MFRSLARGVSLVGSVAVLCALPLSAQEKPTKETKEAAVPQSAQPPAGLCRVWLNDVPAGQQPAATDCASAIKNRPLNARVVFGNLKDEAVKAPPRRFDTSPGIPTRPNVNASESRAVRPVNATVTTVRPPTPDSGRKVRRPER